MSIYDEERKRLGIIKTESQKNVYVPKQIETKTYTFPKSSTIAPKLPIQIPSISKAGEERTESALLRAQKTPQTLAEEKATAKVLPRAVIAGVAQAPLNIAKAVPAVAAATLAEGGTSKRYEEANKYALKPVSVEQMAQAQRIAAVVPKISYPGTKLDEFISGTQQDIQALQTPGNRILAQAAMAAGQMAPVIATGGIAGAGAGYGVLGAQAYGQSFGEAIERGADVKTAGQYAALSSALELSTEGLVGGIPGLGKGVLSKMIKTPSAVNLASKVGAKTAATFLGKTASAVGRALSSKGGRLLVNALGEGSEEVIASALAPSIERSTIDPNATDATLSELAESFAVGGLLSAVLGVPSITLSTGKTITKLDDIDTLTPSETKEVEDELYRLARESNIRKGKLTPEGEPIEAMSATDFANMYGLPTPAPKRFNPKTIPLYSGGGLVGNEAYTRAKTIYDNKIKDLTEYIKNYTPKGTTTYFFDENGLSVDPTRDITGNLRRVAVSNNDTWYSDFWKQNNRKPTKGEAKEIAEKIIDDTLKFETDDGFAYDPELIDLIRNIYSEANGTALDILNRAESDSRTFQRGEPTFWGDVEPVKPLRRIKTKEPIRQRIIERPFTVTPGELAMRTEPQPTQPVLGVQQPTQPTFEPLNRPVQARTAESGTLPLTGVQTEKTRRFAETALGADIEDVKKLTSRIAPTIKDISGSFGQRNDIWEIFRKSFGENNPILKKAYLDPFAKSKGEASKLRKEKATTLKKYVVDELGIKLDSKEAEAVQWFGEGKKFIKNPVDVQTGQSVDGYVEVSYTLDDLKREFPSKWENIVKADEFFRKEYDDFIDQINAIKEQIYPNAEINYNKITERIQRVQAGEGRYANYSEIEKNDLIKQLIKEQEQYITGKRIPKRQNYYRHFKELGEGFAGLKNIFDTTAQIGSNLAGISQYTQPKSKWESFAQRRKGDFTEANAIKGYLDYLPAAAYAIHIDPHISKFRELANTIADATTETKNANNLIRTLREYADSLAGKTNKWDRILEDLPGGRKSLRALNWLNNRVKANVVLGNMASTVSQLANIPGGIAAIKDPVSLARGLYYSFKGSDAIKQSDFMNERLEGDIEGQFNEKLLNKPKEFAKWMLSAADAVGSKWIWNAAYQKALKNGSENPILEADDTTRMLVAGRGIGEIPLNQQRNVMKLIAPFTLEVQNMWRIQRRFINERDFGGLLLFYFLAWAFNEFSEEVKGNRVLFDPIDAIYNAVSEADLSPIERIGRLGGEVLSNIPLGSTMASIYPEYGFQLSDDVRLPSREQLFGDTDPTRFGSGLISQQAITDPAFKLLPAWGGGQLKKTYQFLKSEQMIPDLNVLSQDFLEKQPIPAVMKNDKLRFTLGKSPETLIKGALFGPYATDEGKRYIELDKGPLGEKQTERLLNVFNKVGSVEEIYAFVSENRGVNKKEDIVEKLKKSGLSKEQQESLFYDYYEYKNW